MSLKCSLTVTDENGSVIIERELSADQALKIVANADEVVSGEAIPTATRRGKAGKGTKVRAGKHRAKLPESTPREEENDRGGAGEGRVTKSTQIENLLLQGKSDAEIVVDVDCSKALVGMVRAKMRKEGRLQG
ncbi:MAG TPA: hypothetical protein VFA99_17765 [Acidobacteriaceae bacterium]|nr:hypothetical protein [Acidobacteriaceae bacterium]